MPKTNILLVHDKSLPVLRNMPSDYMDAIITDPPYDMNKKYQEKFHNEFLRISKGPVIVFSKPENQWASNPDQYLFWIKPTSTKNTSRSYSRFVEMILLWGNGTWNTFYHWSQYTNIFMDIVEERGHVFRKPVSLIKRLILNHTNPTDIVLDPFMGSGTLGIACLETNRRFFGIEADKTVFESAQNLIKNRKQLLKQP